VRIALVEDDPSMVAQLSRWLETAGYHCAWYEDGAQFCREAHNESFDVVLLDWLLPTPGAEQVLLSLRELPDWDTPVILINARNTEEDMVRLLNEGADDYLSKPIHQQVLLARIGAVVRRSHKLASHDLLEVGEFRIDQNARVITRHGKPVKLTEKEFRLASFILDNVGRLLSRNHILATVWGYDSELNTRTVDTHISRIRKKLALLPEQGWRLSSIYHQGYRLEQVQPVTGQVERAGRV
jgi:DNA-binding response OmpR family regulator